MGKKSKSNKMKAEQNHPMKTEKIAHFSNGESNNDVPNEAYSEQTTHLEADMDSTSKQLDLNMKVGRSGTKQSQNVQEEDQVTDKDIDEFCDNLDDEANLQFENWVKLLEAKLSGGNKSSVSSKETAEQSCTHAVAIKMEKKNKTKHSIDSGTGGSSTVNVITEEKAEERRKLKKKNRNKSVKNELLSEDGTGPNDLQCSFGACNGKRKPSIETEFKDQQSQKKKRKQKTKSNM